MAVMTFAVVSFQWFFFGYSLAFSHKAGLFIGKLDNFGFMNVLGQPSVGSEKIPDLLFAIYQNMFAAMTAAIVIGAVAERGRMLPCVVFVFIWTTLVYDVIAAWTWNPNGWAYKLGVLDFAGGTPVHITSGVAALAYALVLGPRRGYATGELTNEPHSVNFIVIGTVFLWFGWSGFNGGSALNSSLRAVMAVFVTNLSAAVGGITWVLLDYRLERKLSTVGFCSGVVAGLVCITPGSGYVAPWAAVVYGVVAGAACNYATNIKYLLRIDDSLDVFAVHAIGGLCGNLLTGLFATNSIAALDGYTQIQGGWINHHWIQLVYQLANSAAAAAWSFTITLAIAFALKFIGKYVPALRMRLDAEEEERGVDGIEIGEFAVCLSIVLSMLDARLIITVRLRWLRLAAQGRSGTATNDARQKLTVGVCQLCQNLRHIQSCFCHITSIHVVYIYIPNDCILPIITIRCTLR